MQNCRIWTNVGFELLEYADDSPSELASHVVEIWRRRRRHCDIPAQLRRELHAQLGMARSLTVDLKHLTAHWGLAPPTCQSLT